MKTTFITVASNYDGPLMEPVEVEIVEEREEWALTKRIELNGTVAVTHKPSGFKLCSFLVQDIDHAVEMLNALPTPALGLPMTLPMSTEEAQAMMRDAKYAPCGRQIQELKRRFRDFAF